MRVFVVNVGKVWKYDEFESMAVCVPDDVQDVREFVIQAAIEYEVEYVIAVENENVRLFGGSFDQARVDGTRTYAQKKWRGGLDVTIDEKVPVGVVHAHMHYG